MPRVDPAAVTQVDPGQQSPLMVHPPPEDTHLGPLSDDRHRSRPDPSGTHGAPPQQSAADAHVSLALRQAVPSPLHLGTPSASSSHTPELPTPPQQSFLAEELLHV